MVFERSKENFFEACKTWQKSDVNKGVSRYYDNFEGYSKEHIKNDIQEYQKAITDLKQRTEALKKGTKKDKEKKATLDEVKDHLDSSLKGLKEKQKELETLPQRVKELKSDFQEKMKGLNKAVEEITWLKLQEAKGKEREAAIQKMQELVLKFMDMNKIVSIDEIIKSAGMEFMLENETGPKVVKEFKKLVVMFHESIGARWFDMASGEKIGAKKAEYLKNACTELAFSANAARADNWEVDYYVELLVFGLGRLTITLGIQEVGAYEYLKATQYFLKAREILVGIKKALKLEKLLDEQVALARAYASDTFNIIYLLNSHANWKMIAKNTEDAELKEVATISVRNIEEWVTKQYGFPPDDKINAILGAMIWPSPQTPPEVADFMLLQPALAPEAKPARTSESKSSRAKEGKPPHVKEGKAPGAKDGNAPGAKDGNAPGAKDGKASSAKEGKVPGAKEGKVPGAKDGKASSAKDGKASSAKDGKAPGAIEGKPAVAAGEKPDHGSKGKGKSKGS
jgi:gas vesicle protein